MRAILGWRRLRWLLLFVLVFMVSLAVYAPASGWDKLLRHYSQDKFALLNSQGSFWQGQAVLATYNANNGQYYAITPIQWYWDKAALTRGTLSWQFSVAGSSPFSVQVAGAGISLQALHLQTPMRVLMDAIPNTFTQLGWNGDLQVQAPSVMCNWQMQCSGQIVMDWTGASVDFLPRRFLGDYRLLAQLQQKQVNVQLNTLKGELDIQAKGTWSTAQSLHLQGRLRGEAEFIQRLKNIGGTVLKPSTQAGELLIDF